MSAFNELLSRADALRAKIPSEWQSGQPNQMSQASQYDLRSMFRATDELWKRKQLQSNLQWKPKDPSAMPKPIARTEGGSKSVPSDQEQSSSTYEAHLKQSMERARLEAERAFINQHILDQASSTGGTYAFGKDKGGASLNASTAAVTIADQSTTATVSPHFPAMKIMAEELSDLLSKTCQRSIKPAVQAALDKIADVESIRLWRKVFALCDLKKTDESMSVADYRNSDQWKSTIINQSTTLLQHIFKDHIEHVIHNNLQLAQRGGIPGTTSLVEAYLNVRLNQRFQYQDGSYGKHPIWPMLFYCLRIGDFNAAAKVAKNLQNQNNCSILIKVLLTLHTQPSVDGDRRFQLNAEWKHVAATCQDPYKRAVYAMILGHECPEVNDTIENWLWSRLMNCKLDPVNGIGHFYKLQSAICVDYGEEYFVSGNGTPLLYFTCLWLTGQIERAIDVLFRADFKHHAVHIAILAYQQQLLSVNSFTSAPILSHDSKDPIHCQLNFSRLLLLYVKNFELTDLDHTLCYCFFLRDINFERDGALEGGNVFEACVSRLCFISSKVDLVLGRMSESGDRIPGLIDKFASVVDVNKVIARVAKDFDVTGDSLTACRLYIISGHPNEALRICSKQLAARLAAACERPEESVNDLEEAFNLAQWLEARYHTRKRNEAALEESYLAELSTLIKLTFFHTSVKSDPQEALSILKTLNLLPLENSELAHRVASYSRLPDQVRHVLPSVILALIEALVSLYKDPSMSQARKAYYKSCSNVLLLYVAQINLRFPVQINTKFLQLQSQIV